MKRPYVFISYSSKSKEKAQRVRDALEEKGILSWMAPDSMDSQDCAMETSKAIVNSSAFVLLLDQDAKESRWVRRETGLAFIKKKRIYYMRWDEELPEVYQTFLGDTRYYPALADGQTGQDRISEDRLSEMTEQIELDLRQVSHAERKKRMLWSTGFAAALLLALLLILNPSGLKQRTAQTEAPESTIPELKNLLCSDADTLEPAKTEKEEIEEELKNRPVLESKDYRREQILSVTFVDSLAELPKDAWDVSADLNCSVMAWVKRQPAVELYDLYIGAEGGVYAPETCDYLFAGYTNLIRISFNDCFHTENVRSMEAMFAYCPKLRALDLSGLDTSRTETMRGILSYDSALKEVTLTGLQTPELRSMRSMFYECGSLETIDLSSFQTGRVETMRGLFYHCALLDYIVFGDEFSTAEVVDMGYMFAGCEALRRLELNAFDGGKLEDMQAMFADCKALKRLDFSSFATEKVKTMKSLFYGCTSLAKIDFGEWFTTANVTDLSSMFRDCESLGAIPDLNKFNTGKAETMACMFYGCKSLTKLEFGEQFTTREAAQLNHMFYGCEGLQELNLTGFDTGKVTTMRSLFNGCTSLAKIDFGERFSTANATDLSFMFCNCASLSEIPGLNGFNTEKVKTMESLFDGCASLSKIEFGEQFTTAEVTNMNLMFNHCESLTELDLSGFDTCKVWKMRAMFQSCINLTHIDFGERFTTAEVTDAGYMFWGCKSLRTLDLRFFDTSNVTDMTRMFCNCGGLETLLYSDAFVVGDDTDTTNMFYGCDKLTDNALYQRVNGT